MNKQQKGLARSATAKGFTIIELLVVIAIIAVLASIVLVNVTQYIVKGRDAGAQGNLATMLTNGAVFYDTNSTFTGFISNSAVTTTGTIAAGTLANCALGGNTGFINPCQALVTSTAANGYAITYACSDGTAAKACGATGVSNWCAGITLKGTGTPTFCVDSNGSKKASSTCTVATGVCS